MSVIFELGAGYIAIGWDVNLTDGRKQGGTKHAYFWAASTVFRSASTAAFDGRFHLAPVEEIRNSIDHGERS